MHKIIGVRLGDDPSLIRLLHEILIPLLLGEQDGILLGLEIEMGALEEIGRGLPAHERVFPPVALLQDIPVHAPLMAVPVARLRGGLCGAVDAVGCWHGVSGREGGGGGLFPEWEGRFVPCCSCLEVYGRAGEDGGGGEVAWFAAVHDTSWDRGECSV